jgi:protein-S-isoprenylcysteine O-methyltransferase Ste14
MTESRAKPRALAGIALRSLVFTFLVPGTAAVWAPWAILRGATLAGAAPWRWLGIAPLAAGVAIYVWCVYDFATAGRGTPAPIDAPRELVTRGLYRVTRNPMYVGVTSVLVGEACLFASAALAVYTVCVVTGFHIFVRSYEEPTLHRLFGEAYDRYCAAVPRWIALPHRSGTR